MNIIIKTNKLSKKIGSSFILNDISFTLEASTVVGLLGPNGAGKSTLMKLISGLIKSSSGEIKVFNKSPDKEWDKIYRKMGVLLEPKIPGYLTGKEYLMQVAIMRGFKKARVYEVLRLVGMEDSALKKVSKYSFGMQQRIGLAAAFLPNPKFIMLDEPFVGLDPLGIEELQKTIKSLSESGVAILISSHQLAEIEPLVDRVLFLEKGVLQKDINMNRIGDKMGYKLITGDNKKSEKVIRENTNYNVEPVDGTLFISTTENISVSYFNQILNEASVEILSIEPIKMDLNALFKAGK